MTQSLIQRSFAGGELSPSVSARGDQVKYQTGARVMRNFVVRKEGGAGLRAGTRLVKEIKSSAAGARFLWFVYNDDQTYVIEAGDLYFRFYRQGANIVSGGSTPYEIATPYAIADILSDDPRMQFFQRGDVVSIMHPSYDTYELRRTGHTAWTLTAPTFAPSITAPGGLTNDGTTGTSGDAWVATAIKADSFEESVASGPTTSDDTAGADADAITITIGTPSASAQEYNVYKLKNGVYGFVGIAKDVGGTITFKDDGIEPDTTVTPPVSRNPFSGAGNRPGTGGMYQQRRLFAGMLNNVQLVEGSRSGLYSNFGRSSPLQDDDALRFTVDGKKVNAIRHLLEMLDGLVIMTAGKIYKALGNSDGVLVPTQPPNLKPISARGVATLPPLEVDDSVVYLQARGNVIRDLKPDLVKGSVGRDLTVFAAHLFRGRTITRWCYAENPHSIIYAVRSDGVLLGLTYLPEHEIWGWHRHDTDGTVEDVCSVPEGGLDAVYILVKRGTKRYIERFADPFFSETGDITTDAFYVDCGLTYNGWNTTLTSMRLASTAGWTSNDDLTVIADAPFFSSGDVGNAIVIERDADSVTVVITAYTDSQHVTGSPIANVPASLRNVALITWGKAVDQFSGLDHLNSKAVAILGDGNVIASPNNPDNDPITVASGSITLPHPYVVIHVGLPFIGDLATLDADTSDREIRDRLKNTTSVSLLLESSRGLFVGERFPEEIPALDREDADDPLEGLNEAPADESDDLQSVELRTGLVEINITSTWNEKGRVCIRQVDPLPATVLAVIPNGEVGG